MNEPGNYEGINGGCAAMMSQVSDLEPSYSKPLRCFSVFLFFGGGGREREK